MHTCAVDEANGVKMIRGGTLAGSGDQFTIEKRLSGKPSQMVCICNQKGVACYYLLNLYKSRYNCRSGIKKRKLLVILELMTRT